MRRAVDPPFPDELEFLARVGAGARHPDRCRGPPRPRRSSAPPLPPTDVARVRARPERPARSRERRRPRSRARDLPAALQRARGRARRGARVPAAAAPRSSSRPRTRRRAGSGTATRSTVGSNGSSRELRARVNRRLRARRRPHRGRARAGLGGATSEVAKAMNEPWWIALIKAFVIANLVLGAFAYLTLIERKLLGRMHLRYGPNRVGPVRAAPADRRPDQAPAQGELLPGRRRRHPLHRRPGDRRLHRDRRLQRHPLRPRLDDRRLLRLGRRRRRPDLAPRSSSRSARSASTPSSIGGWASESKYSLLGSMRTCAQLVSYEVSFGLAVLGVVLMAGTLRLTDIVAVQQEHALVIVPAVRSASSASSSPGSPRRTARRSTCRRPSRSSSPATTRSTAACASASSRRPSTST